MADPFAVAVAVLAAGRGSRFGGGKLDAPCAGKPVARWVLDAVAEAGLPPGLLVLPNPTPAFARSAAGWQPLVNPLAHQGIGTSIALAAQWALEGKAGGLIVLLADMPLLDPAYLRCLAAAPAPAATLHPGDRAGVPALLSAEILQQATTLSGDEGAARLLATARDVTLLHSPPGMLLDVDRAEDRILAEERLRARGHSQLFRKDTPA